VGNGCQEFHPVPFPAPHLVYSKLSAPPSSQEGPPSNAVHGEASMLQTSSICVARSADQRLQVWANAYDVASILPRNSTLEISLAVRAPNKCETLHTRTNCPALSTHQGRAVRETSKLGEDQRRSSTPSFSDGQIAAMNRAFKQACARMRLTGSTPVIELVAVRILELAYAGEFDPDKLAETVVAEFGV
jgi:hypothetical protein